MELTFVSTRTLLISSTPSINWTQSQMSPVWSAQRKQQSLLESYNLSFQSQSRPLPRSLVLTIKYPHTVYHQRICPVFRPLACTYYRSWHAPRSWRCGGMGCSYKLGVHTIASIHVGPRTLSTAYSESDDLIIFRRLCLTLQGDEASVTALLSALGILDNCAFSHHMLKSLIYHLLDPSFFSFIQSSPWTTCLVAPILLLFLLQQLNLLVQISQPFLA